MAQSNPTLPILERRGEIRDLIARHQVVVLCGATGSGKTTQVPQICLDMGLPGVIGHTQPRRLAARAVAARIAEERGEPLGDTVGVKVRFHDQTGRRTRIKVLTDGMLLAEMSGDPDLRAYGAIIIDEAHERSLNIDFLLGYLRGLIDRRPALKLIIMSATIDPARFSNHFGGPSRAPVIEVSGRLFPVDIRYRPGRHDQEVDAEAIADAVEELPAGRGDALVFLPGEREIRRASEAIRRRGVDAEVLPLFSRLSQQEQDRIFHPHGRRRVILGTNVAETSLTVPGIRYVIDTGLARLGRYDAARKLQALPIEPVSRASADQRAGRCGRIEAGVCIRLYSQESYQGRSAFTDPEIRRTSLASVILRMKSLGLGRVEDFPFLDSPDAAAIRDGHETLFELGAVASADADSPITEIGARMSRIPVDPRIARMLLAADRLGAVNEVVTLAAALSIQDPRERPSGRQDEADRAQAIFRHERSDFLTLLRLWDQYGHAEATQTRGDLMAWCRDHYLSPARMREWGELIGQLQRTCEDLEISPSAAPASEDAIHRALLTGLISNVACREGEAGSFDYRGVRGNKVQIFPGSVLFKRAPKWIMAAEVVQTSKLFARTVARIEPEWIEELAGHMFRRQATDAHFDADTGQPSAWERVTMSGIVVVPRRRVALAAIDPAAAREMFIREGLAGARWSSELDVVSRNRNTLEQARAVEARLRRRDVLVSTPELAAWFDARVPAHVVDGATMSAWYSQLNPQRAADLHLRLEDVLQPSAQRGLDPALFPDTLAVAGSAAAISYRWAVGTEEDGATLDVTLEQLADVSVERLQWLVPGWAEDLVQALLKTLPRGIRSKLSPDDRLDGVARSCVELLSFGVGSLSAALSEAVEVLLHAQVPPQEWQFKSLPAHLRMRVRVLDHTGRELGADRDVAVLAERFAGKVRRARAARERAGFEQTGLTGWTFGVMADQVETESGTRYPALIDHGSSVTLTLVATAREAASQTHLGLRRLFAIASADEMSYYIESIPGWREMAQQYAQLGTGSELRDAAAAHIADRVFLEGQSRPATSDEFEARLNANRGRLATASREVGESLGRMLEARHRVAQRLSGGTPRLWAASVADIREHAAFLMPRGFLRLLPWERLKHYPRYVETMRARLFALREEGMRAETESLQRAAVSWKRFTGWVAAGMSAEREAGDSSGEKSVSGPVKAPLPQARRAAPVVNVDAGEWAMRPGRLSAEVERYRWALEEFRAQLFAATPPRSVTSVERELAGLWIAVETAATARSPRA